MSNANAIQEYKPAFTEEEMHEQSKQKFGLTDKDIEEILVFIDEFDEAAKGVPDNPEYDDMKPVVDSGNKIPSHCGFMIMSYYANRNGDDALVSLLKKTYVLFKALEEEDPESTKTTDLYETVACIILFSPHRVIRKFIQQDFAMAQDILARMRKRPSTAAVFMSCMGELFISTKNDTKYSLEITKTFQAMIDFLREKNGITAEVPDALTPNFNDLRDIMSDYIDAGNKKESLKNINKLINKKADIGQAFLDWIFENPSCAFEVIKKTDTFTEDLIEIFFHQMKVQYIAEIVMLLGTCYVSDMKWNKTLQYIQTTYNFADAANAADRLFGIIKRGGLTHYGILLRHPELLPQIPLSEGSQINDGTVQMIRKISSVANNLTADISEKSMSITIAPLGRSRIFQDICDMLEGVDNDEEEGGGGGFAAKLRDKDVIKKIRESGISYYAVDQYCGSESVAILNAMTEVAQANPNIEDQSAYITEVYKKAVLKYGIIVTLPYFTEFCNIILSKLISDSEEDDDEDYEEINDVDINTAAAADANAGAASSDADILQG